MEVFLMALDDETQRELELYRQGGRLPRTAELQLQASLRARTRAKLEVARALVMEGVLDAVERRARLGEVLQDVERLVMGVATGYLEVAGEEDPVNERTGEPLTVAGRLRRENRALRVGMGLMREYLRTVDAIRARVPGVDLGLVDGKGASVNVNVNGPATIQPGGRPAPVPADAVPVESLEEEWRRGRGEEGKDPDAKAQRAQREANAPSGRSGDPGRPVSAEGGERDKGMDGTGGVA